MRFKRFCSLGVAAAIGMSVLAGAAAAKEMTTGLSFDFNRNDSGFTPIFSDYPNEQGVEEFYELQNNAPLSEEQRAFAQHMIEEIWGEQL